MQASSPPPADQPRKTPRPMLLLCLAFMGGILTSRGFPIPMLPAFIALFVVLTAWLAAARFSQSSSPSRQAFLYTAVLILVFWLGFLRMEWQSMLWDQRRSLHQERLTNRPYTITGRVDAINHYENGARKIILSRITLQQANREMAYEGKLELRLPTHKRQSPAARSVSVGDRLTTAGSIHPIRGPHLITGMNFQHFRYSQNIFATAELAENAPLTIEKNAEAFAIRPLAYRITALAREHLPRGNWMPPAAKIQGLLGSIAFGVRADLPSQLRENLSRSGLAHITSISGLHVTLVLYMLFGLLRRMGIRRKHAAIITIAVGLAYLFLVGWRIPTIRAVLMGYVLFGQHLFARKAEALNTLGLAGFCLLAIDPIELVLPSFQLSFTAVLMLLLYQPAFQAILHWPVWRPLRGLTAGAFASLVVVLGITPFTIFYFHHFTWGAVLGNLFAVPLVWVFLPVSYAWAGAQWLPLPALADGLGWAVAALASALIWLVEFFSRPLFHTLLPFPGTLLCAACFLALLFFSRPALVWRQTPFVRLLNIHLALMLLAAALVLNAFMQRFQTLRVDFLALGQGDCALIRTSSGQTILIDGGPLPRRDTSLPRLIDYLLAQGIWKVDALLLTHPQADHFGAFEELVKTLPVGMMIEGVPDTASAGYRSLRRTLTARDVPIRRVQRGHRIRLNDNLAGWVLHPQSNDRRPNVDINEHSIVLLLQYSTPDNADTVKLLFTGDIGEKTEALLNTRYTNWHIDLLKVAHHGSRFSTTDSFLEETQPEYAIISVGRNPYGHPHPDVLQRLRRHRTQVLRTDQDGTAHWQIFNRSFRIYTTRSNRLYIHQMEPAHE